MFHVESYPKTLTRAFSSPWTFGSQRGQKELDSGCVQVPFADPPNPWTNMMSTGEVGELLEIVGTNRTRKPKSLVVPELAGIFEPSSGLLFVVHSRGNFRGYTNVINRDIKV